MRGIPEFTPQKPKGYWTHENILKGLKEVIAEFGHFPTDHELCEIKRAGFYHAIAKHGGIKKYRTLLGYEQLRKPNGYWTDETIIQEIKEIIVKIGHFPTQVELKKMGRNDLNSAIATQGGAIKFRTAMGHELPQKPPDYWTDEIITEEIQRVITKLNHFPAQDDLILMNRNDLNSAIKSHGGFIKFRILLGYNLIQKPDGYWTDETVIQELKEIINMIGRFPKMEELKNIGRSDLNHAITRHGSINKFRGLLGYDVLYYPDGYWTDETISIELKSIITELDHFPNQTELSNLGRADLNGAIAKNGGFNKFQTLLGYESPRKPKGYWTDETISIELKSIITELGHFPTRGELIKQNRIELDGAIALHGGYKKFQTLLGYEAPRKPEGYWTDETIITELKQIIIVTGDFPTHTTLNDTGRQDLLGAIASNGGSDKFRKLLGYERLEKPSGYWTDETITAELKIISSELGHFPTRSELKELEREDITGAIAMNGGTNKFRELTGYPISLFDKYISELFSYVSRRGKKTEKIVAEILKDWCLSRGNPLPQSNVKLSKGNVIEFVCDVGRTVGVDVTNTMSEASIHRKWTRKEYYKHLDELWIVVFSDTFTVDDYDRWNAESRIWTLSKGNKDNVKVMSIYDFLENLDYSIDESTKCKIGKYCECTFYTKEQLAARRQQRSRRMEGMEETIIGELKKVIDDLGHFPKQKELNSIGRSDITNAIAKHGGINLFREKFGFEPIKRSNGYWTEENITTELKKVIDELGHFPTHKEFNSIGRSDLIHAMLEYGGNNKFREKLGFRLLQRSNGYWTEETIIAELKKVIDDLVHFPKQKELNSIRRSDIASAIAKHGSINLFRKKFGLEPLKRSAGYWTEETTLTELKKVMNDLGHFPICQELGSIGRQDLLGAINTHGGINRFRAKLGFEPVQRSDGYWTEETIIAGLTKVIDELGHYPTAKELNRIGRADLIHAMNKYGGMNEFRKKLGAE